MPPRKQLYWRTIFKIKGLYNFAASGSMFFLEDWIRTMVHAPPVDPIYRMLFFALCFAFGLGYMMVSNDLSKNHAVIYMGVFGQLSVFAITAWGVFLAKSSLPAIYLFPAVIDLTFAIAFLIFLWKYPKTIWTLRP